MTRPLGLLALCGFAATVIVSLAAAAEASEIRVQNWITTASAQLDSHAVAALSRIEGPGRKLLALRAYLRAGDELPSRWSWSQAQLLDYPNTAEGKRANADISAVEAAFANANPGFTARANRMPRSLEVQLEHWNQNKSVTAIASQLLDSLRRQFPEPSPAPGPDQIRDALLAWHPPSAAPLAAPGLSAHGQGRAFDFQIEHGEQVVAGLDAAAARNQWDAVGWTRKLHAAVVASGKPFSGPLQSPYEPWHYAYTPARVDLQ